jgi:hypothetical protein
MSRPSFTPHPARFTVTPEVEATASTLRDAFAAALATNPQPRRVRASADADDRWRVGSNNLSPTFAAQHG